MLGAYPEDHPMPGINGGTTVTIGLVHGTVLGMADKVIDAVKQGLSDASFWWPAAPLQSPAAIITPNL